MVLLLEINKLRIVEELLFSVTNVIENSDTLRDKQKWIENLLLVFKNVIAAKDQCYLMLNLEKAKFDDICDLILNFFGLVIMEITRSTLVALYAVVPHEWVY
ncbi:MAG: hypothetical protein LBH02_00695 [Methanocalculaceae archaeon]|nr:hypothetical protein [Methanocalculaceae archaeon]